MKYKIIFHEERCIACGACSVACMDQNDRDPGRGDKPFRRCVTEETGTGAEAKMTYRSVGCMHCDRPDCYYACPQECIERDPETGFIYIDETWCLGCGRCRRVCPVQAPVVDGDGKARKCDGCRQRVKAGLLPACVKVCPMKALELIKE